jgi:DNA polymerase alpha subunit B
LNYATPADDKALKFPRKTGDNISPDSNQTPVDTNAVKLGVNLFTSRTNQGECVLDYNNQLGSRGPFIPSNRLLGKRCDVITDIDDIFDNVRQRYRFMFTALDERARAMEKQMIKMRDAICSLHNIDVNELQPVGMPSQNTVFVCGRICCEDASGRMNKSTIMLEGSLSESNGRRVQLDLQPLQSFSLFPGQIVVVEGVNSSGRKMAAKQIFDGCPAPLVKTTASKLLEYHHSTLYQNGKALTIVAAAGPFTTSDNLDYLPLSFLLSNMLSQMPDVIILIGPFVDVSQPLLTEGDVTLSQKNDNGMITEQHIASVSNLAQ